MKFVVVLVLIGLIAASIAAPAGKSEEENDIVSSYYETLPDGVYKYGYETKDGSRKDVVLTPIDGVEGGTAYIEEGSYSYFDPEGNKIEVKYRADETGFNVLK